MFNYIMDRIIKYTFKLATTDELPCAGRFRICRRIEGAENFAVSYNELTK